MIRGIRVLLSVLIIIAAAAVIFEASRPYRADNPFDNFIDNLIGRNAASAAADEGYHVYIELPAGSELDGYMPLTETRKGYQDGEMILIIPSLDFHMPVRAGTSQAELKIGPGLFESSGMPGEIEANVSIAGHRTRDMFYYLDRLNDGDRIYIVYDSYIFKYVFYDKSVVLPTDWSVISGQGYECCTLITCTPIGRADKRLVVRFILEGR